MRVTVCLLPPGVKGADAPENQARKGEVGSGMNVVVLGLLLSPSQGVQMPLHTRLEGNRQNAGQAGGKLAVGGLLQEY